MIASPLHHEEGARQGRAVFLFPREYHVACITVVALQVGFQDFLLASPGVEVGGRPRFTSCSFRVLLVFVRAGQRDTQTYLADAAV